MAQAQARTSGASPARGRGRPRVTSREKIIETALALAAANPTANVSVVAIARGLGIAPMAIYNYFPSRDALMQELSAQLLDRMKIVVPVETSPLGILEIWARSVREHFLRYPELLQILGYDNGYASAAWLMASSEVYRALCDLGFAGDDLARAVRWYWNAVMSVLTVEIRETLVPVRITNDSIAALEGEVRQVAFVLNDSLGGEGFYQSLFDFHLRMAIIALEANRRSAGLAFSPLR